MADREGAVAAGPPPAPTAAPDVPPARKAEQSFFDEPVRRVTLDASPADVVVGAEAETTELRAALDDLRRVLDDVDSAGISPRRRRLPVVAMTGGLVAVVATGLVVTQLGGQDDTTGAVSPVQPSTAGAAGSPGAGSSPSVGSSSSPVVDPSSSAPPDAAGSTPVQSLLAPAMSVPAGAPTSGPGVTVPGTAAVGSIDPGTGTVQVYEQVMLGTPSDALSLSLQLPTALRNDLGRLTPTVLDLQVLLDGSPARAVPAGDRQWVAALSPGQRVSKAVLSYRVTGATQLTRPSTTGRASIVLTPLSSRISLQEQTPVLLSMAGPMLKSISCPTAPTTETVCATFDNGVWTGTLPSGVTDPQFEVQVDLPQIS